MVISTSLVTECYDARYKGIIWHERRGSVVGLCNEAMDYVGCSKVEYSKSTKSKHRNILLSIANYARVFL